MGHAVMLAPMLRIEVAADADLGPPPWSGLLVTSINGARVMAQHPRRDELLEVPMLAVGRSSADAARATGFSRVSSADGDAGDLSRLAAHLFAGSLHPLLYLAGEDRSGELTVPGLKVRTVVVYRAIKAEAFPDAERAALQQGGIDAVLHFSQRSAETFVECAQGMLEAALRPRHYCLSARVAEPLQRAGAARIEIAARPDEASLLALVTPKS
jgi:uroporphyrinogen-III synthase